MKRRDPVKASWFAAGRPISLAEWRANASASRRKPPPPTRKTLGVGPFTRVTPGASNVPPDAPPGWRAWGRARFAGTYNPTREQLDEMRIASIVDQLEALDVNQDALDEIRKIDTRRWYAVELVVEGYHAGDEGDIPDHAVNRRRIRFAGIGRSLMWKIANVAEVGELIDVEVRDVSGLLSVSERARALALPLENQAWAIWAKPDSMNVTLASGKTFHGVGDYEAWKREAAQRIGGRPRKRRGRHTYAEGKRIAEAQRSAERRDKTFAAKLAKMSPAEQKKAKAKRQRQMRAARGQKKGLAHFARVKVHKHPRKRPKR